MTEGAQDRRKVDVLLRFHYGVDPATLDDAAYWQLWADYEFVHEHKRALYIGALRQVLSELFTESE
ncbi:hypothetical protein [Hymenobacter sp. IS2118]|uniref:hypothetical protein n=1 Tax=Hymenobacter sp. IS2118 TaxID=1505605 RepID=UPI00054D1A8A|nr:hypothetical protein [Hymenobacter sp. IS2118]